MRKELEEHGAFNQFEKQQDDDALPLIDVKKEKLKEEMEKREVEPLLELEEINKPLSKQAIEKFKFYFTLKELKAVAVSLSLNATTKSDILFQLSKIGLKPIKPERSFSCQRCGEKVIVKDIVTGDFWDLLEKGRCCEKCKKEKEDYDDFKTSKQISLLGLIF